MPAPRALSFPSVLCPCAVGDSRTGDTGGTGLPVQPFLLAGVFLFLPDVYTFFLFSFACFLGWIAIEKKKMR